VESCPCTSPRDVDDKKIIGELESSRSRSRALSSPHHAARWRRVALLASAMPIPPRSRSRRVVLVGFRPLSNRTLLWACLVSNLALVLVLAGAVPEETDPASECTLRVKRALETVPPEEVTPSMLADLVEACEAVAAALAAAPASSGGVDARAEEALEKWTETLRSLPSEDDGALEGAPTPKPTPEPRPRAPGYAITGTTGDDDTTANDRDRHGLLSLEEVEARGTVDGASSPGASSWTYDEKNEEDVAFERADFKPNSGNSNSPSAGAIVSFVVIASAVVVLLGAILVPVPRA